MAHLVQTMAYVGETPWHGLGNQLTPKQPLAVWARQAGMDWDIKEAPVCFMTGKAGHLGGIRSYEDHKVLFRSDSKEPLSVVSQRYKVVQLCAPHEERSPLAGPVQEARQECDPGGIDRPGV